MLRGGHHRAQLEDLVSLAAENQVRAVDGHIGRHRPIDDDAVGIVVVSPEAVLVPAFKIQAEGLLRQCVEAVPEGGVIPIAA